MRNSCLFLFALLISGCAQVQTPLDDGYDFGDLSEWRAEYCATADPYRRAVLLALAARAGLTLPSNGVCTDPLEVLDAGPSINRA
jgi:hypothetical protein